MTRQEAIQDQIDQIMDTFDFDEVQAWMRNSGWTWGTEGSIPTATEIRQCARSRLKEAAQQGDGGMSSSGGFTAFCNDDVDEGGKKWVALNLYFGYSTINDGTAYAD